MIGGEGGPGRVKGGNFITGIQLRCDDRFRSTGTKEDDDKNGQRQSNNLSFILFSP